MSRLAASNLATFVATVLLWAISGVVPAGAQSPAPSVHPGTKLSFAPVVGTAKLENSTHFAALPGLRGAGDTYNYSVGKMQLTVDVFDAGRRVGAGATNPTVANQFDTEANASEQQIRQAGYTRFERPTVPSTCTYGAVSFRCLVYSAQTGATRLYSKMLLTGYNGYFVKVAIIWSIADNNTLNDADQALNSFIPVLMR
jgi:hypothetical protein